MTHRRRVLFGWIVLLVALVAGSQLFGGAFVDRFSAPGTDAQRAGDLLSDRFPASGGDPVQIVLEARGDNSDGFLTSPGGQNMLRSVRDLVSNAPLVGAVEPLRVSRDGAVALVTATFERPAEEVPLETLDRLKAAVRTAAAPRARAEFGGPVINYHQGQGPPNSEGLGLLAAILILLVALGSAVAMGVPIAVAMIGLVSGISVIGLAANVIDFNTFSPTVALMIGLGVAIDYCLFVVTRFRQGIHDGLAVADAVVVAMTTAGRAVVFAGATVIVAISGLALVGLPMIAYMGLATSIVVAVIVATALTLLPAVLALIGHRIDRFSLPGAARDDSMAARRASLSFRLARVVVSRPAPFVCVVLVLFAVLASPITDMRLGSSDAGNDPSKLTTRQAYDLLARGFGPGFNGPVIAVVDGPAGSAPGAARRLSRALAADRAVAAATVGTVTEDRRNAIVTVISRYSPQDQRTSELLKRIRGELAPNALSGSGATAYLGGLTALSDDLTAKIVDRLPLFMGGIIGLSMLLLLVAFRSVVLPITAGLMNLMSMGATYGVLVAVFQWGWGAELFGVRPGPVESFVPVMVFAILFGLSMDYEVFLLSGIREHRMRGASSTDAIIDGVASTARVITAAALVMSSVFLAFTLNEERVIKEFGFGLGVAILIDATIVRIVLVPAIMQLTGRWNWWLPDRLDRLLPGEADNRL